jgi:hypothetical protein
VLQKSFDDNHLPWIAIILSILDRSMHMLPAGCYSLCFSPDLWLNEGGMAYAGKMPLQTTPHSEGDDWNFMFSRYVDNFDDIFGRCDGHIYGMG